MRLIVLLILFVFQWGIANSESSSNIDTIVNASLEWMDWYEYKNIDEDSIYINHDHSFLSVSRYWSNVNMHSIDFLKNARYIQNDDSNAKYKFWTFSNGEVSYLIRYKPDSKQISIQMIGYWVDSTIVVNDLKENKKKLIKYFSVITKMYRELSDLEVTYDGLSYDPYLLDTNWEVMRTKHDIFGCHYHQKICFWKRLKEPHRWYEWIKAILENASQESVYYKEATNEEKLKLDKTWEVMWVLDTRKETHLSTKNAEDIFFDINQELWIVAISYDWVEVWLSGDYVSNMTVGNINDSIIPDVISKVYVLNKWVFEWQIK